MFLRGSLWLWLSLRASVILGRQQRSPEPRGQNNCYQLNRFHCSFEEAENYCHSLGGELAYTWNQEVQELIWDSLEKGKKWWTGQNIMLQEKHRERKKTADVAHRATEPKSCMYVSRISSGLWSHKDLCSQRHYFICQTDDLFSNQDASYKRNGNGSHLYWRPEKTKRKVTIPGDKGNTGTSTPGPLTALPEASFQNVSDQVLAELAGNLSQTIHGLQTHSHLQKACEDLQRLTAFLPRFSESTQVSIINSFIHLNKQLLLSPSENGSDKSVTVCLFHSLHEAKEAGQERWQNPGQSSEQVYNRPDMPWPAHGKTPEAFLPQNQFSGSSMALTSSIATLMLSSRNISTLPLSSYTLGYPAPVRLGFPSATALEELLNKHPGVDVQITLWRNASIETHPTSLNMSTDHFVISVNITTLEKSLIVCIEAENPLLMTLYLGFQYQPNHTHFHQKIMLPKGQAPKDEEYTWVLTPRRLQYGMGTYYITAVLNRSDEGAQQSPTAFSVVTALTQCYFWDSHNNTWTSDGCQVGLQSTVLKTQCLCDHLTYFGSDFFIVPRTVDVADTVKLFLRVTNNPVGVSLLASLLGLYMLLFIWAWRKDQDDRRKVKITVLADNEPGWQFHYLVQVHTGYRRRAATTAKVVITLYGSEGRSNPHHLWDSQKAVFERGGLDVFLLCTQSSLGDLHGLRLWHDNSGTSPSWYVSQVIVIDMMAKKKWHFLCNCWLAVDLGDGTRDRVFLPVSEKELFSFRHLFSSTIVEKFTQDCLWLSVATRHPWSPASRVQRLACGAALLLCNMLTNTMFWRTSGAAAQRGQQVGPFTVTWSELCVSIQSAVILFPINLVIGWLFQMLQPQAPPPLSPPQSSSPAEASLEPLSLPQVAEELKETVGFLLRRNAHLLLECEQSSWSSHNINKLVKLFSDLVCSHLEGPGCHQQAETPQENAAPENHLHFRRYLLRVLQRLQGPLRTLGDAQATQDFLAVAGQLQRVQELLETHIPPADPGPGRASTSFPILSSEEGKSFLSKGLPGWVTYISWLLLSVTSLVAAFFTALYSLELNKDQATSWVISMILSFLQNIFISQPVKVVFVTLWFSLTMNRMPRFDKEKEQQTKRILALLASCPPSLPGSRNRNDPIYVAPAVDSPVKRPERTWKGKKLLKQTGEILVQILFLALLLTTVYSAQNPNRFHLHQTLRKSFSRRFSQIKLLKHFYPWAHHTLLPSLYGEYRGFVTDGNAFLLGNVLLRQVRLPRASIQEQVRPSPPDQEDTENYGAHWGAPDTNTTDPDSIWHYQPQERAGGFPGAGELAASSGGGYAARLGRNASTALRVLQHLEQSRWLDQYTKSLFVEFVVFSANVNLFCAVTLILEANSVGTFSASMRLESLTPLPASKEDLAWFIIPQSIYYLLICYYTFIQGRQLKQQRWRFFTRKSNIVDLSVILLSFVTLGLDIRRISLYQKSLARYRSDPDRFISFYEALKVNSAVLYLVGFLVLLATIQLWSLLHRNPALQVIGRSLSRAWDEVVGFLLVILILLTGYAIAFNLLFGWSISDYRTFFSSIVAVVGLLMGITQHEKVIALDPVLGSFLIFTSVLLMVLVIINLFVSAILMAFGKERKLLKTQKAATLTDILLQKLSSLLGIQKQQKTPENSQTSSGH
ncbi:polycystic kidney disease protein 1-like 3 [Sorex araneus]|uniref:polycystic kidney disease protein 1-like 3 n=1 Tax=Sorex araneus TaxID=42254 RepID=UPI0024335D1F|nr:polycystic kidney disease protein 1-like 3 [Sorex araneus]